MRLLAFLLALVLAGCTEPPADTAGLSERRVQIGGGAATLLVPPEAQLAPAAGCVAVRLAPSSRSAPTMTLCDWAALPETFSREATLASRATLYYDVSTDEGGGSGGVDGRLRGRLETVGSLVLGVECVETRELPRPTWCLAYLHHIRPAE